MDGLEQARVDGRFELKEIRRKFLEPLKILQECLLAYRRTFIRRLALHFLEIELLGFRFFFFVSAEANFHAVIVR